MFYEGHINTFLETIYFFYLIFKKKLCACVSADFIVLPFLQQDI